MMVLAKEVPGTDTRGWTFGFESLGGFLFLGRMCMEESFEWLC